MAAQQQQPWYLAPISMQFGALEGNGVSTEKGVDLREPFHTPITPIFPGTVRSVATGPYGQEVDVTGTLNGQPVTASYVHLDLAEVAQGQQVGQNTVLGLSGGQNVGGYHPASPAYSTYPHVELSLWPASETPYSGTPINPMSFINSVQSSGGATVTSQFAGSQVGNASASVLQGASAGLGGLGAYLQGLIGGAASQASQEASQQTTAAISNGLAGGIAAGATASASAIGDNFLAALHVTSLQDFLWRLGLVVAGGLILWIAFQALVLKTEVNVVSGVANSKPVKAAARLAPFVR